MNKQELIGKIEGLETEAENTKFRKAFYSVKARCLDFVDQLDEPQAEKVEVNEEQARLLKKYENEPLFSLIGECSEKEEELLARARLCGYTFNPKRWVVKYIPPFIDDFRYYSMDDEIFDITESSWTSDKEDAYPFTEKEKAEAVALLVDGSVEEL